jgi:hypothetical protein
MKKVTNKNCFGKLYPEIVKEWHPTKNLGINPFEISFGSHKKIWWKCSTAEDHEWQTTVNKRVIEKTKCPFCAGQKVSLSNCIATKEPELAKQWHLKNSFSPFDLTIGSGIKVWWKCFVAEDHEWFASPVKRLAGRGCPCCRSVGRTHKIVQSNCLATTHPILSQEWHSINQITPYEVTAGSHKKVWWQCSFVKEHQWEAMICNRSGGRGCPFCCESRGEKKIVEFLSQQNLTFIRQATFEDCISVNRLPFDFLVNIKENQFLIEYNGIQHYVPVYWSNTISCDDAIDNLAAIKKRDHIKSRWAKDKKIPLLIIHYSDINNIDDLIKEFLQIKAQ